MCKDISVEASGHITMITYMIKYTEENEYLLKVVPTKPHIMLLYSPLVVVDTVFKQRSIMAIHRLKTLRLKYISDFMGNILCDHWKTITSFS